jgi:predicted ATP-grasp superfamily ATP-dependent carboligase
MREGRKLPAVLLGGRETAVPVCRSLGRAGISVIAIGEPRDPVRYSRYCSRYVEVGDCDDIESRWLEALLEDPAPGVLVPVSDHGVELVARHREELVARGYVPFEAVDAVSLEMLDKSRSYEIASGAGVPTPRFAIMRTPADIDPALERLAMPCGIKPLEGHLFRERTGLNEKVIPVEDGKQLARLAGPWLDAGLGLMATEVIGGSDDRIHALFTYLDENGEPLFAFTNRKLRQDPPHFGVGCYVKHEEEPEVVELGLRFLRAAGLRGVAHVEFKRDPRDGRFKLIECNPRINLSIELLIASGLDLPQLIYRRACREAPPQMTRKRSGLHLWHPVPDLRSMRMQGRAGELTVWRWLRSLLHRQRFTVFAADDPRPSLVVNLRTFGDALRRRIRRLPYWRRS